MSVASTSQPWWLRSLFEFCRVHRDFFSDFFFESKRKMDPDRRKKRYGSYILQSLVAIYTGFIHRLELSIEFDGESMV